MKKNYSDLSSKEIAGLLAEQGLKRLPDEDFCVLKNHCNEYKKQHFPKSDISANDIAADIDYDFPCNNLSQDDKLIPEYFAIVFEKDVQLNYEDDNLNLPIDDYWKLVKISKDYKRKHFPMSDYSGNDAATDIYLAFPLNTLEEDVLLIPQFMNINRKIDILAGCEPALIFHQKSSTYHYTILHRANDENYRAFNNNQKNDYEKNLRIIGSPIIKSRNLLQKEKRTKEENLKSATAYSASLIMDTEKSKTRREYKNINAKKHRNKNRKRGKGIKEKRKKTGVPNLHFTICLFIALQAFRKKFLCKKTGTIHRKV